ncbi:hypothetical protein E4U41_002797 [Claviceps citrina]|nr:hypothetical protein E4U41_002797 [Claviceps citrina]
MLSATAKSLPGFRQINCRLPQCISVPASPAAVRHASLSAIHRGLRQSERVQSGGPQFSRSRDSDRSSGRSDGFERTSKALDGISSSRQEHKLRKKLGRKAAAAQDEDGTGRRTRRKRFMDPDYSFGKRSLVYELKHGSLKDAAASLNLQEPVRPRRWTPNEDEPRRSSNRGRQAPRQPWNDQKPRNDQKPWNDQKSWNDQKPRNDQKPWNDDELEHHNQHEHGQSEYHKQREHHQQREQGQSERSAHITLDAPARPKQRDMMPMMTVTYTTAASQFLYGKSVVKAALEQRRRQAYNFYIQSREHGRYSRDDVAILIMAKLRGVPITKVPIKDQRLMDTMSKGRPHNGFVLEASPLPQPPVRFLGRLEETSSRVGFHMELDHQSAEERSINGEDTFVRKARNSALKPLVLLLHEILDPGNLGALLRTASYMGIDAVGITSHGSSSLTSVVLKSSAGAAEEVTVFTVNSPVEFLQESRAMGWKTYSAVAPPDKKLAKIHGDKFISTEDIEEERPLDRHPCILVMGNEGHGLPRPVKVATDFEVSVPRFVQGSSVDSLNVSVAAGLLCHSFVKGSVSRPVRKQAGSGSQQAVQPEKQSSDESDDRFF